MNSINELKNKSGAVRFASVLGKYTIDPTSVEYRNIEQLSRVIEGFFALPESKRLQIGENMRLKALSLCDRDSLNKSQNFFYNNLLIRL